MRRIPSPGLVWVAFLPLLIIACSWYRYATGLHFQEVFVRLGEGYSQGTNNVYGVISPGRLVPLQRTAAVEKLWVFPFVQPVQCVFITTAEENAGSVTGFDGEVGVGQGWIDAERRVIARTQTVSSTDPEYGESLQQLGLKGGLLVYPVSISVSRFRSVGQAFNWGGDWSLLWVSTLQGVLIWLSLSALHRGVTWIAADCHPAVLSVGKFGSWLCIPSQMLRLVLLVLLAHQFWVAVQSLLWVRSPAGFTIGVALFAILLCLYVGWLRWIWSSKSARSGAQDAGGRNAGAGGKDLLAEYSRISPRQRLFAVSSLWATTGRRGLGGFGDDASIHSDLSLQSMVLQLSDLLTAGVRNNDVRVRERGYSSRQCDRLLPAGRSSVRANDSSCLYAIAPRIL